MNRPAREAGTRALLDAFAVGDPEELLTLKMLLAWASGTVAIVVFGVLSGSLVQAVTPWIDRLV